ncbi:uncharacterized protein B0H18DRAFT_651436 [Fomitopsis serialis]|uniref:uncharacterized protein n=1 Tax=Fomitopsis serialis TaxID=139415 RepID=UPI002007C4F6|nr:uncharacterized protein B0H18DRAFT_651436 [Neoantrodia serialis]KAH9919245.1 hypothetical protein B0H18DRAFT_651436 [Neoantrodia serialis]
MQARTSGSSTYIRRHLTIYAQITPCFASVTGSSASGFNNAAVPAHLRTWPVVRRLVRSRTRLSPHCSSAHPLARPSASVRAPVLSPVPPLTRTSSPVPLLVLSPSRPLARSPARLLVRSPSRPSICMCTHIPFLSSVRPLARPSCPPILSCGAHCLLPFSTPLVKTLVPRQPHIRCVPRACQTTDCRTLADMPTGASETTNAKTTAPSPRASSSLRRRPPSGYMRTTSRQPGHRAASVRATRRASNLPPGVARMPAQAPTTIPGRSKVTSNTSVTTARPRIHR